MSTSRRLTCRWSEPAAAAGALALIPFLTVVFAGMGQSPQRPAELPPFLKVFKERGEPAILTSNVEVASAVGRICAYLVRQDTKERLPAILLIHDEAGLSDWIKTTARELCGIGYVVLAPELQPQRQRPGPGADEERTLAKLAAVVRWLRRHPDVLPERIGVVGWSWGGTQALVLAANMPLQACVLCDGDVTDDPALIAGLRGTPLLTLVGGLDSKGQQRLTAFRKALTAAQVPHKVRVYEGVRQGFMVPTNQDALAHAAAEQAWVEMYEFLGKHVEDAGEASAAPVRQADKAVATVADVMRAVNEPTGVRGTLLQLLAEQPKSRQQWQHARANAALIAEAGRLLQARQPSKGGQGHWLDRARAFTAAAEQVAAAADRADYAAAQVGLKALAASCAACHQRHR